MFTTGMSNTAEFMGSGWPFALQVTGGDTVTFPWVTSEVYIVTAGTAATIGFSSTGVAATNRIVVPPSSSLTLKVKIEKLFTTGGGTFYVGAALTNITPEQYPVLQGGASVAIDDPDVYTGIKIYPGV